MEPLPALTGRIRTFVRVRPPQGREVDKPLALAVPSPSRLNVFDAGKRHQWSFEVDRVFGPSDGQSDVWEPIERCIEKVVEGYSCSVFAHGQTGTGKTYTMLGPEVARGCGCADSKLQHSSTRARLNVMQKRLANATKVKSRYGGDSATKVRVFASYIQVYNDKLVDLLAVRRSSNSSNNNSNNKSNSNSSSSKDGSSRRVK
ncbi:hypothetical protein ACSSS7_008164 [Eimeria intestinalis]